MRTTVSLDDDVFQAVDSLAKSSGKRLGVVLSELLRRALRASAETTVVRKASGLPVFSVPANGVIIPSSRASELLSDDES
jgi:negative regulator of replication initiation